ncbi:MAG: hypothetical protein JW395_3704 [Nitrospira sp.]|nr:hypothetical protein [Nitrospira sp.]
MLEILEASLLNWSPGFWPVSFVYNGNTYKRGTAIYYPQGVLRGYNYVGPNNKFVEVLND